MGRIGGIDIAARYANRDHIYNVENLPKEYNSWKDYRDYLLETTPIEKKDRMIVRFSKHPQREDVFKQHCKQILLCDWENNIPINLHKDKRKEEIKNKWWDIL